MKQLIDAITRNRNVFIFGENNYQAAFEYIFDEIEVCGYIRDEEMLQQVKPDDSFVIVCTFERGVVSSLLGAHGFKEREDYVFGEDLFYLLNAFRCDIVRNRPIAVWGIGETCKNMMEFARENDYDLDVDLFIDGDVRNSGSNHQGIAVRHLSDIGTDIRNYFVIVASVFYREIKRQLEEVGLVEEKDFLPFSVFASKPSAMLLETIVSPRVEQMACSRPFAWFYYAWYGAYCCCSTWVKYPIGHPVADTPEASWTSIVAKLYRLSMINKTFCFCRKDACPYFGRTDGPNNTAVSAIQDVPSIITLGIDFTCNLHCASCRDNLMIAEGSQLALRKQLADMMIETGWLEKTKHLELSGTGEALFSKVYEPILFGSRRIKRESISLLTNGTLLDRKRWNQLQSVYKIIQVHISMDAASEDTYHKLRRGGSWKHLMRNLQMLSVLRRENMLNYLEIRMVVQRDNLMEMVAFVDLGRAIGVDRVVFTKLLNWGMFSKALFSELSLVDESGGLKEELQNMLQNPLFEDDIVDVQEFRPRRHRL